MVDHSTLGFLLHDVARLLRKRFEQRARDSGLTRSHWQTLAYLKHNEGIHQGGLADLMEIEPITLVRILDKLEQRGLIERRRHPTDRRVWLLYMGQGAQPILTEMQKLGEATRSEALAGVSDEDCARMMHALAIMKANLLNVSNEPGPDQEQNHG
ncbi:MAG TPA: MarR family transcriptional regulator [Xanthobacteraceae bacterium]|uniref:MarR family winged helix-turn-helix transcriptional regulator n=1 Tax=Roseixanthobacter finlandensis TaxID=3119922 RepID=UPI000BD6F026|nr:MAG: MarR family transcriptional regulator [Rhizobiales bacterium 35-66-30]OZB06170.1 MAG: MarR family transcriptional regulator [Rhizobiales bacterium 39-66-18]HQS09090.1 MarR family transcriptional regulator [Xanthobacteraceae bacterium]